MRTARLVTYLCAAIALGGMLSAPVAAASPSPGLPPELGAGSTVIGHLAFIANNQQVMEVEVEANGDTLGPHTVGPVTPIGSGTTQVFDLMASGDGKWLAWEEQTVTKKPFRVRTVLVLRRQSTGHTIHLSTGQAPLGFAGDRLVTSSGTSTRRLVLTPSPRLVKVPVARTAFPLAAYRHGVVEDNSLLAPPGPKLRTDQLALSSFGGKHRVLHNYVLSPTNYRDVDAAWVSGDGRRLVVERGNHQDFDGLGPSSLADAFRLTGHHARSTLGHYGSAKAMWRVGGVSFAGHTDQVWAMWERGTRTGATSVVAVRRHGMWARVANRGIAVAGNHAGDVVVQAGKFVSVGSGGAPEFRTVATGHAMLHHGTKTVALKLAGTAFAWVAG